MTPPLGYRVACDAAAAKLAKIVSPAWCALFAIWDICVLIWDISFAVSDRAAVAVYKGR